MARNFNGTSAKVTCSPGAATAWNAQTANSMAAIVRQGTNGAWHCVAQLRQSGGAVLVSLEFDDANPARLSYGGSGAVVNTLTAFVPSNTWWLIVATSPASSTSFAGTRLHYLPLTPGGAWTHVAGNSVGSGRSSITPGGTGAWEMGVWSGSADFYSGDIERTAFWTRELTDNQVESLGTSMRSWLATNPTILTPFNQNATTQAVRDITGGGADQSALVATTITTTSAPLVKGRPSPTKLTLHPSSGLTALAFDGSGATLVDFTADPAVDVSQSATGFTIAALARKRDHGASSDFCLFEIRDDSGSCIVNFQFSPTGELIVDTVFSELNGVFNADLDIDSKWFIIVASITNDGGVTPVRYHWKNLSDGLAWEHQDSDTGPLNDLTGSGMVSAGFLACGYSQGTHNGLRAFEGDLGLVAAWPFPAASDAAVETLSTTLHTSDWVGALGGAPDILLETIDDTSIPDLMGGGVALTGCTAVPADAGDLVWNFDGLGPGGGGQTVTLPSIASAGAFGSHTITPGAVTVTLPSIASVGALGAHTVTPGAVTVAPGGVASAEAWGSHTVTPGAASIGVGGLGSAEAWGSSTITPGAVTVTVGGLASAEAWGASTVTRGAVTVTLPAIASAEAWGATVLTPGAVTITVGGLGSAETWGSTTVAPGAVTVTLAGVASAEAWGAHIVASTLFEQRMADRPAAYWRGGIGAPPVIDSVLSDVTGNGHDLVLWHDTGDPLAAAYPKDGPSLDGSDTGDPSMDYVRNSNHWKLGAWPDFAFTGPISIALLFKARAATLVDNTFHDLVRRGSYYGVWIDFNAGDYFIRGFVDRTLDGGRFVDSPPITANTLYHVIFTYDGAALRLYVDGVEVASDVRAASALAPDGTNFVFAQFGSSFNGYDGLLDEVAVYDHALSPARVAAHYDSGLSTELGIAVPAIASAEAWGSATITPGSVTVTLPAIPSAEAWGGQTVTPGSVAVTVGGLASAEAWGSHVVTAGGTTIILSGLASSEAWGATHVNPGAVTVTLPPVGSAEAWGSTRIDQGIALTGLASAEAWGATKVQLVVTLPPVATAEAWGAHRLNLGIALTGIPSGETWGAIGVGSFTLISFAGVGSAEAWGAHTLAPGPVSVTVPSVGSSEAWGTHTVQPGAVTAAVGGVPTAEAWGAARVDQTAFIAGIGSAEAWGATRFNLNVTVPAVASSEAWGQTRIDLSAIPAGIPSAEAWGTTRFEYVVATQSIPSTETWGAVVVTPGAVSVNVTGLPSGEAWGATVVRIAIPDLPIGVRRATIFTPDRRATLEVP